jgi:hypothetical protein
MKTTYEIMPHTCQKNYGTKKNGKERDLEGWNLRNCNMKMRF